jgi:hypothetical protein
MNASDPPSQDTTRPLVLAREWGQQLPKPSTHPIIHDLVIDDMAERSEFGKRKYGRHLRSFNGRDALQDAYEEVLDLAVYLRQMLYERDKREEWLKEETGEHRAVTPEEVTAHLEARTKQLTLFDDPDKTIVLDKVSGC